MLRCLASLQASSSSNLSDVLTLPIHLRLAVKSVIKVPALISALTFAVALGVQAKKKKEASCSPSTSPMMYQY